MNEKQLLRELGAWECEQHSPYHLYSVGVHTEKVVEYLVAHNAGEAVIRAAWLHDIGKMEAKKTLDNGRDIFPGHAEISARIAEEMGEPAYIVNLVRYHDATMGLTVPVETLVSFGRIWYNDLLLLMDADSSAQHPIFRLDKRKASRLEFETAMDSAFIKLPKRTVHVMVGLPGSGKSTYADTFGDDAVVLSSDKLREEWYGNAAIQGDNKALFAELHRRVRAALFLGKSVVYDATNLTPRTRKLFLDSIADVPRCKKVAVVVMTPLEECIRRNSLRNRVVPENVIRRMAESFVEPRMDEGFNLIHFYPTM